MSPRPGGPAFEAVRALAQLAGRDVGLVLRDEHERWDLLASSLVMGDRQALVLAATQAETDGPLAAAVVVRALEIVEPGARAAWVAVLRAEDRAFPQARSDDLEAVDRIVARRAADEEIERLPERTWWLQLRLAQVAEDARVLEVLARDGSTKRVRNLARQRQQRGPER